MSLGFYDLLALSTGLQVSMGSSSSLATAHGFRGAGKGRYYSDLFIMLQLLRRKAAASKRRKEVDSPSSLLSELIGGNANIQGLDSQVNSFRASTANAMSSILLAEI